MTKLKHLAIIISSYSPELTQRSQDNLSKVLSRAGIVHFPSDVTFDPDNDLGGMDFSIPDKLDRDFFEQVASEYLGMSLEFFHYNGEPVDFDIDLPPDRL